MHSHLGTSKATYSFLFPWPCVRASIVRDIFPVPLAPTLIPSSLPSLSQAGGTAWPSLTCVSLIPLRRVTGAAVPFSSIPLLDHRWVRPTRQVPLPQPPPRKVGRHSPTPNFSPQALTPSRARSSTPPRARSGSPSASLPPPPPLNPPQPPPPKVGRPCAHPTPPPKLSLHLHSHPRFSLRWNRPRLLSWPPCSYLHPSPPSPPKLPTRNLSGPVRPRGLGWQTS